MRLTSIFTSQSQSENMHISQNVELFLTALRGLCLHFTTGDVQRGFLCTCVCGVGVTEGVCIRLSCLVSVCQSVCRRRASGLCVEGRSNVGPGNLPQMKPDSIPGDQHKQTFQSCRKSISTWWDSPPPPTPPCLLSSLSLPLLPPSSNPSLYHLTSLCPTPVNKATQDHRTPAVPLKPRD